jgi:YVTN family beta-propeller protein
MKLIRNICLAASLLIAPVYCDTAYVSNYTSASVSAINTATNTIIGSQIPAGNGAQESALTPDGAFLYVSNILDGTVSVIQTTTNTNVATIPTGPDSFGIGITPNGKYVYVCQNAGNVSVILQSTNMVITNIVTGAAPRYIFMKPSGDFAYVICDVGDVVSVIDTNENSPTFNMVTATIPLPLGSNPLSGALTRDGAYLYVSNASTGTVSVIQTSINMIIATISVGPNPKATSINYPSQLVYASNETGGSVSVIDANPSSPTFNQVLATVTVGNSPFWASATPDGSFVYVPNLFSDTVSVIDARRTSPTFNNVLHTVNVGANPSYTAPSLDGRFIYVSNEGTNTVSVIRVFTNTVIQTLTVGQTPGPLKIAPSAASATKVFFNSNRFETDIGVLLRWPEPIVFLPTSYQVYQDGILIQILPATRPTTEIHYLKPRKTYTFSIIALDAYGQTLNLGSVVITTPKPHIIDNN